MTGQKKSFIPDDSETIIQMEIERLKTFKDHPFKVQDDSDMKLLKESIEKYGILNPLIVRPLKEGVYEIVSGHRRRFAAEKLEYRKVPVIIRVMRDEESIIAMVDANLQRERISFSEKAFAYKMKEENVDLMPGNIELSGLEITLGNVMSREMILKEYIEMMREHYQYIILDCMPSLGMLTINALVAADSVLIPVQAAYLPVKGLQQLIRTISMVKKRLNRRLKIEGILLTMVDFRTNYAKDITEKVRMAYGSTIKIFDNVIPLSVKAAEASAEGISIFKHCQKGKVAQAYQGLTMEVLENEK